MRIDTGVREGDQITPHYDPLIAKLIAQAPIAPRRSRARSRHCARVTIEGIHSNVPFLIRTLNTRRSPRARSIPGSSETHRTELVAA